jgi:alkanesulfonate monooxygenase SsuD/methylene tetrahydromethanopterin reductase-like flavin-dependent oxidoreductase (luciferase family)
MTIEFGLVLPAGPPRNRLDRYLDDADAVLTALAPRIAGIWMTDHFFWDDAPTHEAWTVLAFAAARWPSMTIGPIVLGQSYRNPALLAKMGATLQSLSHGRLIMALGAGWKEDEYHAYGYDFPKPGVRIAQFAEALEILRLMWREPGRANFTGQHYRVADAYCEPKPDPVPPLVVGGSGDKTLRLAARYADWWNTPDASLEFYRERSLALDRACAEVGRDPHTLRRTWFGRMAVAETQAAAEALSDGRWTHANALVGTVEQVRAQIAAFAGIGVDYFMVEVLGSDDPARLRVLRDDVLA